VKGLAFGLGLLVGALLVYVLLGSPAERETMRAQEETLRLSNEKRALLVRRSRVERVQETRLREKRPEESAKESSEAVARLRLSLLEILAGQPVTGIRLTVVPGAPPLAAEGRVRVEGAFDDLVALSGRLVGPGSGLVLRRAQFATAAGGSLVLEVDGFSVGEGWR
jgi:hypothetical protein